MKNNDFEEDRTRRAEKKDNKSTQEEPKMVPWLPRSSQETSKSSHSDANSTPRARQEEPKKDLTTSTLTASRSSKKSIILEVLWKRGVPGGRRDGIP